MTLRSGPLETAGADGEAAGRVAAADATRTGRRRTRPLPARSSRLPGDGSQREPQQPVLLVLQLYGCGPILGAETDHFPLLAVFGLDGHKQISGLVAAGPQPVHHQGRAGGQAEEGVDPPAEGHGELLPRCPYPALLVHAGPEAEEVPGHGQAPAVLTGSSGVFRGGARPGIAKDQTVHPLPQMPLGEDQSLQLSPGLGGHGQAAHGLTVQIEDDLLQRSARGPVRLSPQAQRHVPRGGEEEFDLGLRTVAPDVRPRSRRFVVRPSPAQHGPGLGGPQVHEARLMLDLGQVEVGDEVVDGDAGGGGLAVSAGGEGQKTEEEPDPHTITDRVLKSGSASPASPSMAAFRRAASRGRAL